MKINLKRRHKEIMKTLKLAIPVILAFVFCSFIAGTPWLAPKEAESMENPFKNQPLATKAGATIFAQQCVVCHGEKGKGDGLASSGLDPKPANLTLDKTQSMSDGAIFWKITTGRAPMPTFNTILTFQQRWQVVNYVRELRPKTLTAKK